MPRTIVFVDNTICASTDGIELLGADTTRFTIQRNNIGVNAAVFGVATLVGSTDVNGAPTGVTGAAH